ncbi:MAG: hypothetical protein LBQ75_02840 [Zoogloeaceae bacterium]|nr:hypothetical protein [Zoogloeaceae bacterium]
MKTLSIPSHAPQGLPSRQKGAILLIGMSILIVVTLFALAAIRGITAQERIAGGFYDREISFAAAETALHYAEREFMRGGSDLRITEKNEDPVCSGCSIPNTFEYFNSKQGYTDLSRGFTPLPDSDRSRFQTQDVGSVSNVNRRPMYLAVKLEDGGDCGYAVRINGIGFGRNENTITVLETIVCKPS